MPSVAVSVESGTCALVLDHLLGEAASASPDQAALTGTLTMRYLRGTPLGPLRAGVFIQPAWARDPG